MMTSVASSSQTYDDAGNLTHTAAIYSGIAACTPLHPQEQKECQDEYVATVSLSGRRFKKNVSAWRRQSLSRVRSFWRTGRRPGRTSRTDEVTTSR
ncbi:MAG: hypothetical protein IPK83_16405 [Planctomycetes bacterium]|nr:hypothetical protein [Planctomycetota bacterium]